jgi:hypothetical protein
MPPNVAPLQAAPSPLPAPPPPPAPTPATAESLAEELDRNPGLRDL